MAHRIYIYNIQNETGETYPHYLGEWNYVLSPLLLPLFSSNIRSKDTQLYADKAQGISNLRRFYDLLGNTYQLIYKKAFYEPVNQMFQFLEELPYDTFQIDATDVFNMNEEAHRQQAQDWVIEIKEQAAVYEKAMKKQSLEVLNKILTTFNYSSFLEALQTDWINYGLGFWNEEAYKYGYAEVFIEHELAGLRDAKNNILAPAIYQAISPFIDDVALVKKDNKFGYITTKGIEIVPTIYEVANEAFDIYALENEREFTATKVALVGQNNQYGLLDVKENRVLIPLVYDQISCIVGDIFNVKANDAYFLVNAQNRKIIEVGSPTPFEFESPDLFFSKTAGSKKYKYYSVKGVNLGEFAEDSLEAMPNQYYYAKPSKSQQKIVVVNHKGEIIESDIDQILTFYNYQSFAFRKNQAWFLYDTTQNKQLATEITISKAHADYLSSYFDDVYVLATPQGIGLFDAKQDQWLIEPNESYTKIEHMNQQLLRVQHKKGMRFWNGATQQLSADYTYVSDPIATETQQLLVYKNEELYVFDQANQLQKILPEQMGELYTYRYNLRGKDLSTFTKFYTRWKEAQGADYYQYFDEESLYELSGQLLQEGNIPEAVNVLELGVKRLHPEMMTELAIIYSNSENESYYDLEKAHELYQKAAKLGEKNAWNNLGYQFQNGLGTAQNTEQALAAYTQAGKLGNGLGWANLGDLYYFGEWVDQDFEKALDYYLKAQQCYVYNDDKIVDIYFNQQEYKKVLNYLKKDADETYSPIYYAILYEGGLGGLKVNLKKAIAYYEKAMLINHYSYAVTQLLYHYRKDSDLHNEDKFNDWLRYAEVNAIEIDYELLGLPKPKKGSFINKLFKK